MYFLPLLACKNCFQPIWLPPPIQSETSPNQSPWRWGNRSLNVACLSCNRAFEYWAPDCRWRQFPTHQTIGPSRMAVHQLSIPCGIKRCVGRIQILVIAKPGSPPLEGSQIAASLYVSALPCNTGHEYTGPINVPTGQSLSFEELKSF